MHFNILDFLSKCILRNLMSDANGLLMHPDLDFLGFSTNFLIPGTLSTQTT